jgi:hypothetical protein
MCEPGVICRIRLKRRRSPPYSAVRNDLAGLASAAFKL